MWNNIGGKIKGWAKFVCWAGIILSVIMAFVAWFGNNGTSYSPYSSYGYSSYSSYHSGLVTGKIIAGVILMVLGSLFSWIGSFFTYGFGELIESAKRTTEQNHQTLQVLREKTTNDQSAEG